VRGSFRWMVLACCSALLDPVVLAQGMDVSAKIVIRGDKRTSSNIPHKGSSDSANVVVWLSPMQPVDPKPASAQHPPYRLLQKDKQFHPHLLVVPTGTSVEFPNADPFFHNVFSLFNGKRFDLGLYESGTSRSVRFDREGVSYIFCNIHPEMGAVVLALSTPYYAVSGAEGIVTIHGVPAGSYRLNVWSESAQLLSSNEAQRIIQVPSEPSGIPIRIGEVAMQSTMSPMGHHRNKFGEEYQPEAQPPY
jgi:plastocyanin